MEYSCHQNATFAFLWGLLRYILGLFRFCFEVVLGPFWKYFVCIFDVFSVFNSIVCRSNFKSTKSSKIMKRLNGNSVVIKIQRVFWYFSASHFRLLALSFFKIHQNPLITLESTMKITTRQLDLGNYHFFLINKTHKMHNFWRL